MGRKLLSPRGLCVYERAAGANTGSLGRLGAKRGIANQQHSWQGSKDGTGAPSIRTTRNTPTTCTREWNLEAVPMRHLAIRPLAYAVLHRDASRSGMFAVTKWHDSTGSSTPAPRYLNSPSAASVGRSSSAASCISYLRRQAQQPTEVACHIATTFFWVFWPPGFHWSEPPAVPQLYTTVDPDAQSTQETAQQATSMHKPRAA